MTEITYDTFARRLGAECQKVNEEEGHEGHVLYLIPSHDQQIYDGRGIDGSIDWDNVGGYSVNIPEVVLGCSCELIVSEETTMWGRIESCRLRGRYNEIRYIDRMAYQYRGGDERYGVKTNATVLSNGLIQTDRSYKYPAYSKQDDCLIIMQGVKNFRFTDGKLLLIGYGWHVDAAESLSLTESHNLAKQINPELDPWFQEGETAGWRTYIKEKGKCDD